MSRTYTLHHFSLPLIVFLLSLMLAACGGGEDESATIPMPEMPEVSSDAALNLTDHASG